MTIGSQRGQPCDGARIVLAVAVVIGSAMAITHVAGCAGASDSAQSVELQPLNSPTAAAAVARLTTERNVSLSFPAGISLERIPAGTSFERVGEIPQGQVYRPIDRVLQVRSWNSHEAYLVIDDKNQAVGAYLPQRHGFLPASHPVPISQGAHP